MNSPLKFNTVTGLGYQLSNSDEAVNQAITTALELVRKMRHAGGEIRTWAEKTTRETRALLAKFKELQSGEKTRPDDVEKSLWELTSWENHILQVLRSYIGETSTLVGQLKTLNPPLTSQQLKPFMDAMLSDRQVTMSALDILTRNIEQMTAIKGQIRAA